MNLEVFRLQRNQQVGEFRHTEHQLEPVRPVGRQVFLRLAQNLQNLRKDDWPETREVLRRKAAQ